MTNTAATPAPYDWKLDEAPELETPASQIWALVAEYDRAAALELNARQSLMGYLASLNADRPPAIGDLVTPWTLLRESDSPRYPIIDILKSDAGSEPEYVIRLSPLGQRPDITIYGPGAFFVAARA